mmetsp:Transcript_30513/g.46056  ORF Transcript_30513/g.46056 Transcript_30513/m.46056 type:complete len:131 (+) Transcript_30513:306-698(+)
MKKLHRIILLPARNNISDRSLFEKGLVFILFRCEPSSIILLAAHAATRTDPRRRDVITKLAVCWLRCIEEACDAPDELIEQADESIVAEFGDMVAQIRNIQNGPVAQFHPALHPGALPEPDSDCSTVRPH